MKQSETTSWNLGNPSYALTARIVDGDFDQVVQRVRDELLKVGFGVLTEIDLSATLKKKLEVDVPRYLILGACNPKLAYQAVRAEPGIGALLPCNVMVVQEEGTIAVAAIDPVAMFGVVGNPSVSPMAAVVRDKLAQALNGLSS